MAEGEKSVGEYNIKDGAFVVLMIKKSVSIDDIFRILLTLL
jgi:hypothetical protein